VISSARPQNFDVPLTAKILATLPYMKAGGFENRPSANNKGVFGNEFYPGIEANSDQVFALSAILNTRIRLNLGPFGRIEYRV
jgi:hypothetical protein